MFHVHRSMYWVTSERITYITVADHVSVALGCDVKCSPCQLLYQELLRWHALSQALRFLESATTLGLF